MEVDCAGCAGCCLDWRPLAPDVEDHERRGPRDPIDGAYNLVPLSRDDVRALLDAGYGDAMTPRLWRDGDGVELGGARVASVDGKPAFFLGLRQPPKPVAPFGTAPTWLPACAFLDPRTLQCRIHGEAHYPEECAAYPGHNLELGARTECERVEGAFGGERLVGREPPADLPPPLFGPQAVGQRVFVHHRPDRLGEVPDRMAAGALTAADRAEFVGAAAAGSPGTTAVNEAAYREARGRALAADSWVGRSIDDWGRLAEREAPDPGLGRSIEEAAGAPPTPGWDD